MKKNSLSEDELKVRHELLLEILGCELFDSVFEFYKNIFTNPPHLVVFMSRKSWRVFLLFLPLLEKEGINVDRKKITHDRMVQPWFAELETGMNSKIKVFVIDDTLQTGRALDDCVRRLVLGYNVDKNNITVAVFAVTDDSEGYQYNSRRINVEKGIYTVLKSKSRKTESIEVKWGGGKTFCSINDVTLFSFLFIEALHACSEPYVGYIPAFRLPIIAVQDFLGAERGKDVLFDTKLNKVSESKTESTIPIPGYLEQEDLKIPLRDSSIMGFYNITSHKMRQHDVDAFYFSLPVLDSDNRNCLPFLPAKNALSIAALRFYLNRKTGFALIVPYISLKDCRVNANIVKEFPEQLKPLMRKICSEKKWRDNEEYLTAYRLIRYASGYLWGKFVFKEWFGREIEENNIVSNGGICSDTFFAWLNGPSAEQDLKRIWSFFTPKTLAEKTENHKHESKTSFKKIIRQNLSKNDAKNFSDAICNYLMFTSSNPEDYFGSISMLFRCIFDREHKMLKKYADKNKEKDSIPDPFHGFPMQVFFALILQKYPELKMRRDVLITVMLMLCDVGITVTQLQQSKNVIGTVLLNGEQSCHPLAFIAPEYAHFLSELHGLLKQNPEKLDMIKKEIHQYFENEKSTGINRLLSSDELMYPLEYIRANPEHDLFPYTVIPRSSFFDRSELFFLKLREKLTA